MGDEALFEKTINTLNKVGEIIHLLLIYIKKPQFIMFLTVLNRKILKNVDKCSPPCETIMDYSTTLKTNTLTQKDAVYFQTGGGGGGGVKVVFIL